jgi:hypothetical protein
MHEHKPQSHLNNQFVPRRKHSVSLQREITASPRIHKTNINVLCVQTEEFVNAETGCVHRPTTKVLTDEEKEAILSQKTNSRWKQSTIVQVNTYNPRRRGEHSLNISNWYV